MQWGEIGARVAEEDSVLDNLIKYICIRQEKCSAR